MTTYICVDGFGKFGAQTSSSLFNAVKGLKQVGYDIIFHGIEDPKPNARENAGKKIVDLNMKGIKIYGNETDFYNDILSLKKQGHDVWVYNAASASEHLKINSFYVTNGIRVLSEKPLVLDGHELNSLHYEWKPDKTQIDHAKVETENETVLAAELIIKKRGINITEAILTRANAMGISKAAASSQGETHREGVEGGSMLDKDHDRAYFLSRFLGGRYNSLKAIGAEADLFVPFNTKYSSLMDVWGYPCKELSEKTADASLLSVEKIKTDGGDIKTEIYTGWFGVRKEDKKKIKKIEKATSEIGHPLIAYCSNINKGKIDGEEVEFDFDEIRLFEIKGYDNKGRNIELVGNMIPPRKGWTIPGSANFLLSNTDGELQVHLSNEEGKFKAHTEDVKPVESLEGDQMERLFKKSILGNYGISGKLAFRDIEYTLDSRDVAFKKALESSSFERELKKAEEFLNKKIRKI